MSSSETLGFDDLMALACGKDTVAGEGATLSSGQAEEMKQLAILFAELEREFGQSDDPDLRFAAAFARQCALGELGTID
jgi:hypothetical protein